MTNVASRPTRKTNSYLINRPFQLRFVGMTLILVLVVLGAIYASNLYFISKLQQIGLEMNFASGHPFFLFIKQQQRLLEKVFLWTGAGVSLVIMVGGIFLSHKIAGPIHRLDSHIQQIIDSGEWKAVSFRKGDFFPELARHLNALIKNGRERMKS